jgi:peptidoglycan/LPS O-acetylase OafA/YrhL
MRYVPRMGSGLSTMERRNNFGALRLLFAFLVILSHAPQELDGNFSREPLVRLFHTVSLGNVAVAGFFIISGFLVTQSFLASASVWDYFKKRILRIYPGFLGAFLFCIVVVAPLVSPGVLSRSGFPAGMLLVNALTLSPPGGGGEFSRLPWSLLNVPMWTIGFEARCYILAGLAGVAGLLRYPRAVLGLAVLLLGVRQGMVYAGVPIAVTGPWAGIVHALVIDPNQALYFAGLFFAGATFRLYHIGAYGRGWALVCGVGLVFWLGSPALAELGLAVFFPYLIFWAAFALDLPFAARIGRGLDLSYGLYLYAWPVSRLILMQAPGIGPWGLAAATTSGAALLACCSWFLLEQPALSLKRRLPHSVQGVPPGAAAAKLTHRKG